MGKQRKKTEVVGAPIEVAEHDLSRRNAHLGQLLEVELSSGRPSKSQHVSKKAAVFTILDKEGRTHHHELVIEKIKKSIKDGRVLEDSQKIRFDDDLQIDKLRTFLGSIELIGQRGRPMNYFVAPIDAATDISSVRRALELVSGGERADLLVELMERVQSDHDTLEFLVEKARATPDGLKSLVNAINVGRFRKVLESLEEIIEADAEEKEFQKLLSDNPWVFGSEYSALLEQRRFTRDEQQDFMLRRSSNGYLEVVEIKTALKGKPLFLNDGSHDSFYPRHELSEALGQVMKYLEKLDAQVSNIKAEDGLDVTKIRAKLIIGLDAGDDKQKQALRRFNAHLHRIEVLTFDQLQRIGEQVVKALSGEASEVVKDGIS